MKSTPLALEPLFIALLLTGCASHRPMQVAEHVTRDTVYINKLHYDSIYIDHWQKVYQQSDTIYLDRTKYEYRYRLLRDTVYKAQHEAYLMKSASRPYVKSHEDEIFWTTFLMPI